MGSNYGVFHRKTGEQLNSWFPTYMEAARYLASNLPRLLRIFWVVLSEEEARVRFNK